MSKRILVVNGFSYAKALEGLGDVSFHPGELVLQPEEFGLVLFTGGADVDPSYYNDTSPSNMCGTNPRRDAEEERIFNFALKHDILMTGICRGIQFLNVMAGGQLMHHINGHAGSRHSMVTKNGDIIHINSLHHQMVIPSSHSVVVGWSASRLSEYYIGRADSKVEYYGLEVEAAIFPKIKSFGVQYHPEMMSDNSEGYLYYHRMVEDALNMEWSTFVNIYEEGQNNVQSAKVCKYHGTSPGR